MKMRDLPSIKSIYTVIANRYTKLITEDRLGYDLENHVIDNGTDLYVSIAMLERKKRSSMAEYGYDDETDTVDPEAEGTQFMRTQWMDTVGIKIFGDNDNSYDAQSIIEGLLASQYSADTFMKNGAQLLSVNEFKQANIILGGVNSNYLLLSYNVLYSLREEILDNNINLYVEDDIGIDSIKVEE